MAKLRMGILDGFQGRVGPVVGYRLGSKWIMRRLPQQVCNPRTERQVAHRMMFRDIVRLASALLPALKVGYRAQAGLWEMTEGNAFVKMNWLRDRMPGFNELRISVGAVPMVGFTRAPRLTTRCISTPIRRRSAAAWSWALPSAATGGRSGCCRRATRMCGL